MTHKKRPAAKTIQRYQKINYRKCKFKKTQKGNLEIYRDLNQQGNETLLRNYISNSVEFCRNELNERSMKMELRKSKEEPDALNLKT